MRKYKGCIKVIILAISCKFLVSILLSGKVEHPYLGYSFNQYLSNLSYQLKSHTVVTPDGYILELYRIPCKRFEQNCSTSSKTPVLMIHGLLSSAIEWIVQGPDTALGLRLANAGYDVWLANNRGVLNSRNHTKLDPNKDEKFWDYSYHELGVLDLPTFIDYVLNSTNKSQLHYVGNSQGVTQFLVMGSEKPEYTKKINLATLLVPAMGIFNGTGLHKTAMRVLYYTLETVLKPLNTHSIYGLHSPVLKLTRSVVLYNQFFFDLFMRGTIMLIGGSLKHTNVENFTYILQSGPTEASLKQFKHYIQTGVGEDFRQFDYGIEENLRRYNQTRPPQYNLFKISTPAAVFYSRKDQFMEKNDTNALIGQLPKVIKKYEVPCDNFYHQDAVLGTNLDERVLGHIYDFIVKYNTS